MEIFTRLVNDDIKLSHNGNALRPDEIEMAKRFLSELRENQLKKNVTILYRGDNSRNAYSKLRVEYPNNSYLFNARLFMVGEKARYFQTEYYQNMSDDEKKDTIDKCDKRVFSKIFKYLNQCFTRKYFGRSSLPKHIETFRLSNPEFSSYFEDQKNIEQFIQNICTLTAKDKFLIKDYFLSFLHTVGKAGFFSSSQYISTSTNSKISSNFAGLDDPIIILSWIPRNAYLNPYLELRKIIPILTKIGIPPYSPVFRKQREITLKGSLLPHYIIGYLRDNVFEINTGIFGNNPFRKNWIEKGLWIDQKIFQEVLAKTDYHDGVIINQGRYYPYKEFSIAGKKS